MPVYEYMCLHGHFFDRYLKLENYQEEQTCECGQVGMKRISAPFIRPDITPYVSPIDGETVISSRRQRVEDLRRNGCIAWEPGLNQDAERRRSDAANREEKEVEATIDSSISNLPGKKKEQLAAEMEHGVDTNFIRSTPNVQ